MIPIVSLAFPTESGDLYMAGSNENMQLGAKKVTPGGVTRVAALEQLPVRDMACGVNHTVAITSSGKIATWGSGEFG